MRPSLLISLCFAATPALSFAASPTFAIEKDGVEISIQPAAGGETGTQVQLDLEARTDEAARRLGFLSLSALAAVDCHAGTNKFVNAVAYAQLGQQGVGTPRRVSGEWVRPNADSYMFEVTQHVCGAQPAASPTTSVSISMAPASPRSPAARAAASGPLPIVTNASQPAPPPPPAASLAVAPSPPPPPPAGPSVVRMSQNAAPTRTAAPARTVSAAPTWTAKADGRGVAQVAAASTAKDAQRVLNALRGLITPPLTQTVEPAVVQNANIYRASVVGFASLADAKAFCVRAASVSKTCWVHWKAEPAKPGAHA